MLAWQLAHYSNLLKGFDILSLAVSRDAIPFSLFAFG